MIGGGDKSANVSYLIWLLGGGDNNKIMKFGENWISLARNKNLPLAKKPSEKNAQNTM